MRRQFWEAGNIDYMGKDSFDNIWARISKTIDNAPVAAATSSVAPAEAVAAPVVAAAPASSPKPATTPVKKTTAAPAVKKSPTGK